MSSKASNKRKDPPGSASRPGVGGGRSQKRQKTALARTISTQPADSAINERGELDVAAFVKAREFEIAALEQGIKSAKHGLSQRAFQQVPRQLRRRTASHNVKKVPRRLRRRAEREIKEDNTPTGSERKKELNSKQRLRRETAKRAAKEGAKAREQREKLAAAQKEEAKRAKVAAKKSEDESEQPLVMLNKGNEAPAAIRPINPPQAKNNQLSSEPGPVSKFRKRQKDKTWLPTHMFHAKRAHMTPPAKPLWKFAMPLSPTERAYRTTHRAANTRGCIAWDTSYKGTVQVEGVEASLLGALRALGVPEVMLTGGQGEGWRKGGRSWTGWVRRRDAPEAWIAPALILWCPEEKSKGDAPETSEGAEQLPAISKQKRKLLLRVHPAGFLDLWNEILKVAKMQRPQATIQDLRYDIGSIEIQGPAATEALAAILRPIGPNDNDQSAIKASKLLKVLGSVVTPGAMGSNLVLNARVSDPRLHHPPPALNTNSVTESDVFHLQQHWPATDTGEPENSLFDPFARFSSCRLQSSQKAINRRKGATQLGGPPKALSSDPRIPVIICSTPTSTTSSNPHHESWTLMLPWHWVLPIWTSLMYVPLSCGGTPRFGGLDEMRQLAFERGEASFPMDFPGTAAGIAWEQEASAKRREEWERRPPGKRTEWASVDLGHLGGLQGRQRLFKGEVFDGLKCDWAPLLAHDEPGIRDHFPDRETGMTVRTLRAASKLALCQVLPAQLGPPVVTQAASTQAGTERFVPGPTSLTTVRIRFIQRGVPATCARVYRLPRADTELRERWITLLKEHDRGVRDRDGTGRGEKTDRGLQLLTTRKSKAMEKDRAVVAASNNNTSPSAVIGDGKKGNNSGNESNAAKNESNDNDGDDDDDDDFSNDTSYPPVPDVDDLIGFVTTGNFNLAEGGGTAVGNIALAKVWGVGGGGPGVWEGAREANDEDDANGERKSQTGRRQGICIVRNSGARMGRLARWMII